MIKKYNFRFSNEIIN